MNFSKTIIFLAVAAVALATSRAAETDGQVEARKVALDLAGAFSNEGFKIRDGHWAGEIKVGEQAFLAVNLYAGNQYWFSVGANEGSKTFAVHVFDETGKPVTTENYEDAEKAAAGFSPTISGQYFVSIEPSQGEGSTYCLVYSYK